MIRPDGASPFNMLAKRGAGAEIPAFSPHDMRRTFISDLLDRCADIATVQSWPVMPK